MKRIMTLLLSAFIPLLGYSQTTKTVHLTFSQDDFTFNQVGEGYEIGSTKHMLTFKSDARMPALPYILEYVPLDIENEYDDYTCSIIDTLVANQILLNSNTLLMPPKSTYEEDSVENLYNVPTLLPLQQIEFTGVYKKEGIRCACFLISPFKYNVEDRTLFLAKSIDLNIRQKTLSKSIQQSPSFASESPFTKNYAYVIITNSVLFPAFQKLAAWKTMKGVPTTVLTIEDISNDYEGNTLQLKIKNALKDYWKPYNRGMKYVLLGGDIEIVPTQMCYIKHIVTTKRNTTQTFVSETPTDWFYGCLDTNVLDWDSNNNGTYGEIEDNIDLTADAVVSRIPVRNYEEAENIVERIIEYERFPEQSGWQDNILICGRTYNPSNYNRYDGTSDAHRLGEGLYNNSIAPYWSGEKSHYYDTGTNISDSLTGTFTAEHLQELFSKGYSFIHTETHGKEFGLQVNDGPNYATDYRYYDTLYATSLVSPRKTIFTTSACFTNAFDYDEGECLGEAFIRNHKSGILSYIGNSRESWLTNGYSTNIIHCKMYENLFNNYRHQLGISYISAKNEIVGLCNEYTSSWRWTLFSLNMLGDPEMPVFTSVPVNEIEGLNIYYSYDDELTIETGSDTCTICSMSRDDLGATYYEVSMENHTLADIEDDVSFCITKPNHIPYLGVYAPTVHLQNDTIKYNYHVFSKNTLIGHNVTNNRDEGAFIVKKGKTTIEAPQGVTINDNFEIKLGAELEIYVNNL